MSFYNSFFWPKISGPTPPSPNYTHRQIIGSGYEHLGWGTEPINVARLQDRADENGYTLPAWVSVQLPANPNTGKVRPPLERETFTGMETVINGLRAAETLGGSISIPNIQPNLDGKKLSRDYLCCCLERWDYWTDTGSGLDGTWHGYKWGNAVFSEGEDWAYAIQEMADHDCYITSGPYYPYLYFRFGGARCIRGSNNARAESYRVMGNVNIPGGAYPQTQTGWVLSVPIAGVHDDWNRSGWEVEVWLGPQLLWADIPENFDDHSTLLGSFTRDEWLAAYNSTGYMWVDATSAIGTITEDTTFSFWLIHKGDSAMSCTGGHPNLTDWPSYYPGSSTADWYEGIELDGVSPGVFRLHTYVSQPSDIVNPV